MREEEISIKALVVCPTGIGTSKMLASRIKKEIFGIDLIEIKSIKEIQQEVNLKSYDLIISTVKLPFIDIDYILVSPLLTEENIVTIRNYVSNNIESLTENKHYLTAPKKAPLTSSKSTAITEVLTELKDVQSSIEAVLKNFRVYRMSDLEDYERILQEMVRSAEKENLLTHAKDVMDSLKNRERKGGLGIPGTGMALYHCRSEYVHELIFQVSHLEKAVLVKGMDGNNMYMKNLLLMLAPEELSVKKQEIVSLISTSLIENQEAIMIFSSANEEMIRERLETIFLDYLYTNLIRE
jgi:mannitol operon transcriptional antiterminator